ncbi:hypothetical protein [Vibrio hyugaensis]|uniref:Lipoprotein n=1 Tax=Vibrio hyugaensis TaxID=1534743 RepID=A0ABQ5Y3Z9_9VIBR|nr:hypothetical protein [Vibrio hyugaensis]GLR05676.1 hypothetical protein GCM10007906_32640 [Vibrio hyugaensis]
MNKTTLIIILLTTAGLSGCDSEDISTPTPLPIKSVRAQTINLVDYGKNQPSDVQIKAYSQGSEQIIYSGLFEYGSSASTLLITQQKSPSIPYTFKLFDSNSQLQLTQTKKTLKSGQHELVFAFGDVSNNQYEISIQDRPSLPKLTNNRVPIYVMDAGLIKGERHSEVTYADQHIKDLPNKTFSSMLTAPEYQESLEMTFTRDGQAETCHFSTQDKPELVVLSPYGNCFSVDFLETLGG